jgi:hypothetical protein
LVDAPPPWLWLAFGARPRGAASPRVTPNNLLSSYT